MYVASRVIADATTLLFAVVLFANGGNAISVAVVPSNFQSTGVSVLNWLWFRQPGVGVGKHSTCGFCADPPTA